LVILATKTVSRCQRTLWG